MRPQKKADRHDEPNRHFPPFCNAPNEAVYVDQFRLSITSQKVRISNLYTLDTTYVTQYNSRFSVVLIKRQEE